METCTSRNDPVGKHTEKVAVAELELSGPISKAERRDYDASDKDISDLLSAEARYNREQDDVILTARHKKDTCCEREEHPSTDDSLGIISPHVDIDLTNGSATAPRSLNRDDSENHLGNFEPILKEDYNTSILGSLSNSVKDSTAGTQLSHTPQVHEVSSNTQAPAAFTEVTGANTSSQTIGNCRDSPFEDDHVAGHSSEASSTKSAYDPANVVRLDEGSCSSKNLEVTMVNDTNEKWSLLAEDEMGDTTFSNVIDLGDDTLLSDFLFSHESQSDNGERLSEENMEGNHRELTCYPTNCTKSIDYERADNSISKSMEQFEFKVTQKFCGIQQQRLLQQVSRKPRESLSVSACCLGHSSNKKKLQREVLKGNNGTPEVFHCESPCSLENSKAFVKHQSVSATPLEPGGSHAITKDKKWFLINHRTIDIGVVDEAFSGGESIEKLKRQIQIYEHIVQYADLLHSIVGSRHSTDIMAATASYNTNNTKVLKNYLSWREVIMLSEPDLNMASLPKTKTPSRLSCVGSQAGCRNDNTISCKSQLAYLETIRISKSSSDQLVTSVAQDRFANDEHYPHVSDTYSTSSHQQNPQKLNDKYKKYQSALGYKHGKNGDDKETAEQSEENAFPLRLTTGSIQSANKSLQFTHYSGKPCEEKADGGSSSEPGLITGDLRDKIRSARSVETRQGNETKESFVLSKAERKKCKKRQGSRRMDVPDFGCESRENGQSTFMRGDVLPNWWHVQETQSYTETDFPRCRGRDLPFRPPWRNYDEPWTVSGRRYEISPRRPKDLRSTSVSRFEETKIRDSRRRSEYSGRKMHVGQKKDDNKEERLASDDRRHSTHNHNRSRENHENNKNENQECRRSTANGSRFTHSEVHRPAKARDDVGDKGLEGDKNGSNCQKEQQPAYPKDSKSREELASADVSQHKSLLSCTGVKPDLPTSSRGNAVPNLERNKSTASGEATAKSTDKKDKLPAGSGSFHNTEITPEVDMRDAPGGRSGTSSSKEHREIRSGERSKRDRSSSGETSSRSSSTRYPHVNKDGNKKTRFDRRSRDRDADEYRGKLEEKRPGDRGYKGRLCVDCANEERRRRKYDLQGDQHCLKGSNSIRNNVSQTKCATEQERLEHEQGLEVSIPRSDKTGRFFKRRPLNREPNASLKQKDGVRQKCTENSQTVNDSLSPGCLKEDIAAKAVLDSLFGLSHAVGVDGSMKIGVTHQANEKDTTDKPVKSVTINADHEQISIGAAPKTLQSLIDPKDEIKDGQPVSCDSLRPESSDTSLQNKKASELLTTKDNCSQNAPIFKQPCRSQQDVQSQVSDSAGKGSHSEVTAQTDAPSVISRISEDGCMTFAQQTGVTYASVQQESIIVHSDTEYAMQTLRNNLTASAGQDALWMSDDQSEVPMAVTETVIDGLVYDTGELPYSSVDCLVVCNNICVDGKEVCKLTENSSPLGISSFALRDHSYSCETTSDLYISEDLNAEYASCLDIHDTLHSNDVTSDIPVQNEYYDAGCQSWPETPMDTIGGASTENSIVLERHVTTLTEGEGSAVETFVTKLGFAAPYEEIECEDGNTNDMLEFGSKDIPKLTLSDPEYAVYPFPDVIDFDEKGSNISLGFSTVSVYTKIPQQVLAICSPGDPRAQLVRKITQCKGIDTEPEDINSKDKRTFQAEVPILGHTDYDSCNIIGTTKNTQESATENETPSPEKDFNKINQHKFTTDSDPKELIKCCYIEDQDDEDLKSSLIPCTKAKAKLGRPQSRLPPLSDPIICSRLSKQQTMDILDEFCNIVRPLSPLPEEDGDHFRLKRSKTPPWSSSNNSMSETVCAHDLNASAPCAVVKGMKRMGACSVSVPCASAIQYEVCGITVVQLFGTPPNLQLQPAEDSQVTNTILTSTAGISIQALLRSEEQESSKFAQQTSSALSASFKETNTSSCTGNTKCLAAATEKQVRATYQPNSLEKLCISSLKRHPECSTKWINYKLYPASSTPENESTTDAVHKTRSSTEATVKKRKSTCYTIMSVSEFESASKSAKLDETVSHFLGSTNIEDPNSNSNHGDDEMNEGMSNVHSRNYASSHSDLMDTFAEIDSYICDTMSTPIVLSAADRVYHVSGGSLRQSPTFLPLKDGLLSHKLTEQTNVDKDDVDNCDQQDKNDKDDSSESNANGELPNDLLSKAMESAGLTEDVIDKFLRSDFAIRSFILDNETSVGLCADPSDADEFLSCVLDNYDECNESDAHSSNPSCSEPFPKITLTTQPSMPQPGCSWAPTFNLNTSSDIIHQYECESSYSLTERGTDIHCNWACLASGNSYSIWDESMPSTSKMYRPYSLPSESSHSTFVSYEDGQLLESKPFSVTGVISPAALHDSILDASECQSHQDLTMLRPVKHDEEMSTFTRQDQYSLTRDPDIVREALNLFPLSNLTSSSSAFSINTKEDLPNGTLRPSSLTDISCVDQANESADGCRSTGKHTTAATRQSRCSKSKSLGMIGVRRRELALAILDRDVIPYTRASARRRPVDIDSYRDKSILDEKRLKTRLSGIPFEARSLVCIDRTPLDSTIRKRGNQARSKKAQGRLVSRKGRQNRRKSCNQRREQHIRIASKLQNKKVQSELPASSQGSNIDASSNVASAKNVKSENPVNNMTADREDERQFKTLIKYYATRQATVDKFTKQLNAVSPGLLKRKHDPVHWTTYKKVNQISTKIGCPLRAHKSGKARQANIMAHRGSGQKIETELLNEVNCNNNFDHDSTDMTTANQRISKNCSARHVKKPQQSQKPPQHEQEQKQQEGKYKMKHKCSPILHRQQLLRPQNQQEKQRPRQALHTHNRLPRIGENSENYNAVRKKFERVKEGLSRTYNKQKHHEAPCSISLSPILSQMPATGDNTKLMTSASLLSDTAKSKKVSRAAKRNTLPKIPSVQSSLVGSSKDESPALDNVDKDSVSVLRFVQRLDSKYGDQFTQGDPETKTRLNKLCNQYLNLYGARKQRVTTLRTNIQKRAIEGLKLKMKDAAKRCDVMEDCGDTQVEMEQQSELNVTSHVSLKERKAASPGSHESGDKGDSTGAKPSMCRVKSFRKDCMGGTQTADTQTSLGTKKRPAFVKSAPEMSKSGAVAKGKKHKSVTRILPSQAKPLPPRITKIVNRLTAEPIPPDARLLHKIDSWESEFGKSLNVTFGGHNAATEAESSVRNLMASGVRGATGGHHLKDWKAKTFNNDKQRSARCPSSARKSGNNTKKPQKMRDKLLKGKQASPVDASSSQGVKLSISQEDVMEVTEEKLNSVLGQMPSILDGKTDERIELPDLPSSARTHTPNSVEELYTFMENEYYKNAPPLSKNPVLNSPDGCLGDLGEAVKPREIVDFAPISPINPTIPKDSPFCFLNCVDHPPVHLLSENPTVLQYSMGPSISLPHVKQNDASQVKSDSTSWVANEVSPGIQSLSKLQKRGVDLNKRKYGSATKLFRESHRSGDDDSSGDERLLSRKSFPTLEVDEINYIANIAEAQFSGETDKRKLYSTALPAGLGDDFWGDELDEFELQRQGNSEKGKQNVEQKVVAKVSDSAPRTQLTEVKYEIENDKKTATAEQQNAHAIVSDDEKAEKVNENTTGRVTRGQAEKDNIGDTKQIAEKVNMRQETILHGSKNDTRSGKEEGTESDSNVDGNTKGWLGGSSVQGDTKDRTELGAESPDIQTNNQNDNVDEDHRRPVYFCTSALCKGRAVLGQSGQVFTTEQVFEAENDYFWPAEGEIGAGDGLCGPENQFSGDFLWDDKTSMYNLDDEEDLDDADRLESLQSLRASVETSLGGMFKYVPYAGMQFVGNGNGDHAKNDHNTSDPYTTHRGDSLPHLRRGVFHRSLSCIPEVEEEDEEIISREVMQEPSPVEK